MRRQSVGRVVLAFGRTWRQSVGLTVEGVGCTGRQSVGRVVLAFGRTMEQSVGLTVEGVGCTGRQSVGRVVLAFDRTMEQSVGLTVEGVDCMATSLVVDPIAADASGVLVDRTMGCLSVRSLG